MEGLIKGTGVMNVDDNVNVSLCNVVSSICGVAYIKIHVEV
jgi:hypothetical protein